MTCTFLTIFEFEDYLFTNFQHEALSIDVVEFHLGFDGVKVEMVL